MNDDFLSNNRKPPRDEFAQSLYERISQEGDNMNHLTSVIQDNDSFMTRQSMNGSRPHTAYPYNRKRKTIKLPRQLTLAALMAIIIAFVSIVIFQNQNTPANGGYIITPIDQQQTDQPITSDNINQLQLINQFGQGLAQYVNWSPDGETIAVTTSMGIWVYSADNLDEARYLIEVEADRISIGSVAFSPDGSILGFSSLSEFYLWDVNNNQAMTTPFNPVDIGISTFTFNSDGSLIASGDYEGNLTIWDVATGEIRSQLSPFFSRTPINTLTFSNDDTMLIFNTFNSPILMLEDSSTNWENIPFEPITLDPSVRSEALTNSIIFSNDDSLLFTRVGTNIVVWDMATRQEVNLFDTTIDSANTQNPNGSDGSKGGGGDLTISPDNTRLATVDDIIRIWDISTGEQLNTITIDSPDLNIASLQVAFDPDWSQLLTLDFSGVLRMVDLETSEILFEKSNHAIGAIVDFVFTHDSSTVIFADQRSHIYSWDMSSENAPTAIYPALGATVSGQIIAIHPEQDIIAFYDIQENIVVYNLVTGETIHTLENIRPQPRSFGLSAAIEFSTDGQAISAISPSSEIVRTWDLETGAIIQEYAITNTHVATHLAYSPDGTMMAISAEFNIIMTSTQPSPEEAMPYIEIYDVESGTLITTLVGHEERIRSLAFVDNDTLISTSDDTTVKRWSIADGSHINVPYAGEYPENIIINTDLNLLGITTFIFREESNNQPFYQLDFIDLRTNELITSVGGLPIITANGISPDNHTLMLGLSNGVLQIWRIQ